ncbi:MAG: metal-dependent hydrolase [Desulfurobacteriaceae bacterium]
MTAGTHIIGAIVLASALKLPLIPAVVGALVPDVDLKKGLPKFRQNRTLFNSHRGITHHILILPVLLFISVTVKDFLNQQIGIYLLSFSVGYASHLLLDLLTPLGIPYKTKYYPRLSLKLFRTGRIGEIFVILALVALMIAQVKTGSLNFNSFFGEKITKTLKEVSYEILH